MGHSPLVSSTPRCTIWPLVGPTGRRQPSHSPMAAVQAPPATAMVSHPTEPCPSTSTEVDAGATGPQSGHGARDEGHATGLGPGANGGGHPPAVDPRPVGDVEGPVDRAERREEDRRLLGRDLDDLAGRALLDHLGERPEPLVLVRARRPTESSPQRP